MFLKHFQAHTKATTDSKVLLILDNHASHLSVVGIDFCRENGIVLLSFPPHCSHKRQPLDRSVYGPLKKYINNFQDQWMRRHPGQTMTIYDLPGIAKDALPLAATTSSAQYFSNQDFAPSIVTDRPCPPLITTSASPLPLPPQAPPTMPQTTPPQAPPTLPQTQGRINKS